MSAVRANGLGSGNMDGMTANSKSVMSYNVNGSVNTLYAAVVVIEAGAGFSFSCNCQPALGV